MTDLYVVSAPVSGGRLVDQLGIMIELRNAQIKLKMKYIPDLILGASGGNLASYLSLMSDWNITNILRICKHVSSKMFVRSWWPKMFSFMPSILLSLFTGSVYRAGEGARKLFNHFMTREQLEQTEIWSGTYSVEDQKAEFYCNKPESEAMIKNSTFRTEQDIYDSVKLHYMNYNINQIADVALASASIPLLVEHKSVKGKLQADGGTMYSSPTQPLASEIMRIIRGISTNPSTGEYALNSGGEISPPSENTASPRRLCHFYICPYDVDTPYTKSAKSSSPVGLLDQIMHTQLIQDRSVGINMLRQLAGDRVDSIVHVNAVGIKRGGLKEILEMTLDAEHFTCIIYPYGNHIVDILNLKYEDIEREISESRDNLGVHLWYLPYQ